LRWPSDIEQTAEMKTVVNLRVLALMLWVVTLICFAAGWFGPSRAASAAGLATLVLYIAVAARARSVRARGEV
jgi:hypothetical protein